MFHFSNSAPLHQAPWSTTLTWWWGLGLRGPEEFAIWR